MASTNRTTRTPRSRLADSAPSQLIDEFLEEIFRYSKTGARGTFDPLVPRSDGLGFPVSAEAIRIARRLAAAERASSAATTARFSASAFEQHSMIALGDTIDHLKEQAEQTEETSSHLDIDVLELYRSYLKPRLSVATKNLICHIPCHIFHATGAAHEFTVGRIHFYERELWASEFVKDHAIREHLRHLWSREALPLPQKLNQQQRFQLERVRTTIGAYGWVGTVLVRDHDFDSAHSTANVLVSLALDTLSVGLHPEEGALLNRAGVTFFRGGSRLASAPDGALYSGATARLPGVGGKPAMADQFLAETTGFREAAGDILAVYADKHQHGKDAPWLIERWVNAVHWFGEARREASDFMAVVKYGCALDILTGAGGSLSTMSAYVQTAIGETKAIDQAGKEISVNDLVNNIFNEGRSALTHGEAFGLLADRRADRQRADIIVQTVIQSVTEPLGDIVRQNDRMLEVGKDQQVRAFLARLESVVRKRTPGEGKPG